MPGSGLLGGRYRIENAIGQGGMGVVYRAVDTAFRRYVAVKTIKGEVDELALEYFRKESEALASLSVPNIVDIYDVGEFTDKDGKRPYFVMPLLQGANLGAILDASESRLDPERLVGIICQACKGLQAAHNRNVIHRDLKPSNLFVLEDDSVKIIDFGVAHLAGKDTGTTLKGTLYYMAPEQLDGKPTPQSDIFSLGVVCYQALTGRRPFDGKTIPEVITSIRSEIPAPIPDLNPSVSYLLAKVVHRALAKQPYNRFTAREFSDFLQRALRNDPLPQFEALRIGPRLNQIRKALGEGDCRYAGDLLHELEAEGYIEHEIAPLRAKIEGATRSRTVHQLLESARARKEEGDYPLALEKVRNARAVDPGNIDAIALEDEIQNCISTSGIDQWYRIARQHLDNKHFAKSREAVDEILKLDPAQKRAKDLKEEIRRSEQEQARIRQEIHQLYESALRAYGDGEISTALTKLERVIELGKQVSGNPQANAQYVSMYDQMRQERDELQADYAEGRKALESQDFAKVREICKQVLDRRPQDPLFKALSIAVDHRERQARSEAIAELHTRIEAETDLEKKFQIVKEAVSRFPDEPAFTERFKSVREERDLVNGLIARARHYQSQGMFTEARNQWDTLRTIYPRYPALDYELESLSRKQQESLRAQTKQDWVAEIERAASSGNYAGASELMAAALSEFNGDSSLIRLKHDLDETASSRQRAQALFEEAEQLAAKGNGVEAIHRLRTARALNPDNANIRVAFIKALLKQGNALLREDWRAALPFRDEALELDPNDAAVLDLSRRIDETSARERELRSQQKLVAAAAGAAPSIPGRAHVQPFLDVPPLHSQQNSGSLAADSWSTAHLLSTDGQSSSPSVQDASLRSSKLANTAGSAHSDPDRSVLRRRDASAARSEWLAPSRVFAALTALVAVTLAAALLYRRPVPHPLEQHRPTGSPPQVEPKSTDGPPPVPVSTQPDKASNSTPNDVDVVARPSDERPIEARPPRSSGLATVHFTSDPAGAAVKADSDNKLLCFTPCELNMKRGEHTIVVSADNRVPVQRRLRIPGDENTFVPLSETAAADNVVYVISHSHLNVSVDGQDYGHAPLTLHLKAGDHQFTITGAGVKRDETVKVMQQGDAGPQIVNIDKKLGMPKDAAAEGSNSGQSGPK